MSNLISNNSDFLFIYEAALCNPNGDPDQENKPRMDYETKTNLVTDTRVKRYIRDFLKSNGLEIFVDMEGDSKVASDTKLKAVINRVLSEKGLIEKIYANKPEYLESINKIIEEEKTSDKVLSKLSHKDYKNKEANYYLLAYLVTEKFIDIRMFGSAFAVAGFTKAYTGAIQLNWGYSLNNVELLDSSSIVTIMNDDNSTFGKDYRVKYSLLAFHGAVNKFAAKSTGLSTSDLKVFRSSIWQSIGAMPTRSKINQYPKAYVEIVYNDDFSNGHFGDLRNLISTKPKEGLNDEEVQKFDHLTLDISKLKNVISSDKDNAIKDVFIKTSPDFPTIIS